MIIESNYNTSDFHHYDNNALIAFLLSCVDNKSLLRDKINNLEIFESQPQR